MEKILKVPTTLVLLAVLMLAVSAAGARPARPGPARHKEPQYSIYPGSPDREHQIHLYTGQGYGGYGAYSYGVHHTFGGAYRNGQAVEFNVDGFNIPTVRMTLYRVDPAAALRSSLDVEPSWLDGMNPTRLRSVRSWSYHPGKDAARQGCYFTDALQSMPAGIYMLRAQSSESEDRLWFMVTDTDVLVRQSRQELLLFAVRSSTGQPIPSLRLTLMDQHGKRRAISTDKQGMWRGPIPSDGYFVAYGWSGADPVFVICRPPAAPSPALAFISTDRPLYRPSQKVLFRGVARSRTEAPLPNGFRYDPLADKPVEVQIYDSTNSIVYDQTLTTNARGSFAGDLQLATEPALGGWRIVVPTLGASGGFEVQDFRKPEMTADASIPASRYLGGSTIPVTISARYFFGQPVARARVQYSVSFGGYAGRTEPSYSGAGLTNVKGELNLSVKTKRLPIDRDLQVQATIMDLSRRSISVSTGTRIAAGQFILSVNPDRSPYRPGDKVKVTATASDPDGKPVQTSVRVTLTEQREDSHHRYYQEKTIRDVVTGAKGQGTVLFTPMRPGDYSLQAVAFDSGDDRIEADSGVEVANDETTVSEAPALSLSTDSVSYRPGEVASLVIRTNLQPALVPNNRRVRAWRSGRWVWTRTPRKVARRVKAGRPGPRWALLTVEGERLYESQVLKLVKNVTVVKLPLDVSHFPRTTVNLAMAQDGALLETSAALTVVREETVLQVQVAADRTHYAPGDTATCTVTTRDYKGNPTPADVVLGVVDASALALGNSLSDIHGFFYDGQFDRVRSNFSFTDPLTWPVPDPGGDSHPSPVGSGAGASASSADLERDPGVRRVFKDTAAWAPLLETDENGTARAQIEIPDNLTTWEARAWGITNQSAAGNGSSRFISTKSFLVRLELPRFYVDGDEGVVSTIVHNYSGVARHVRVAIDKDGTSLGNPQFIDLAPDDLRRVDWHVRAGSGPGSANPLIVPGTIRLTVDADGGPGGQDAMELTIPLQPSGLKTVRSESGALGSDDAFYESAIPDKTTGLEITLEPTLVSTLSDVLSDLQRHPYGYSEQVASDLIADAAALELVKRTGLDRWRQPQLEQEIQLGLQDLYWLQHTNGGWAWWRFGGLDEGITAYVLRAMVAARDAGALVDSNSIRRGAEALRMPPVPPAIDDDTADRLLTQFRIDPTNTEPNLIAFFEDRKGQHLYARADLCQALAREAANKGPAGTADRAAWDDKAATLARELEQDAVLQGPMAHWTDDAAAPDRKDDTMVTARVLQALLAARPDSDLIEKGIRWLTAQRAESGWGSTWDTAEVAVVLATYLGKTQELAYDYQARVLLDGQPVKDVPFKGQPPGTTPAPVTAIVGFDQLQGHHTLRIERKGKGTLYYCARFRSILPGDKVKPDSSGMTVKRTYTLQTPDPVKGSTIFSGDAIEVKVDVDAEADYRHVVLEDPIPAGCQIQPNENVDGQYVVAFPEYWLRENRNQWEWNTVRLEDRDDKVVLFFDWLPKGHTVLNYTMYAESPGLYQILPALAWLAYLPEVRGSTAMATARIEDAPEGPQELEVTHVAP